MSTIGDRMRELRGASSLREMAEAIGIKYSAWARYESGDVLPGAEIIEKICRVHACSADWLLGLNDRGSSTVIGNNNAVGTNARVTVRGAPSSPGLPAVALAKAGEMPACSKCPHLKKLKKLEALLSK